MKRLLVGLALLVSAWMVLPAEAQVSVRRSLNAMSGSLLFYPDNTYDIGASGATRPQNAYIAGTVNTTNLTLGTNGEVVWTGRSVIGSSSDGVVTFQNNARNAYADLYGKSLIPSAPAITVGSGTGITVNTATEVREVVYKVTIAHTNYVAAAVTADATIGTLPAKTLVTGVMADLTQAFACAVTCTSTTLSFILGRGAGGAQFLASFDADAAAGQFGDADAELGTTMARAAAIQAGSPEAWASTQAVVLRLTSGTGNIGTGAATNLSQGSVTIYLTTKTLP